MKALRELLENVIRIDTFFAKLLNALYNSKEFQDFVINLNTQDQLYDQGINSVGIRLDSIAGGYARYTIQLKNRKGQPVDRVTLKILVNSMLVLTLRYKELSFLF